MASRKAVTLAELMIAILFLAVVLTGLLSLFIKCMLLNESNRNLTTAASHAQYVMESIRAQDNLTAIKVGINAGTWNWSSDSDFTSRDMERLSAETTSVCYYAFSCGDCDTCSDCALCTDVPADPLRVLVRIDWDDASGRDRSYVLKTVFTTY